MKFTIEKNVILENLTNVVKAISNKNIIPILNGIKFELEKDGLYLTASDSELTIRAFIDKKDIKKIEEEGSIIIKKATECGGTTIRSYTSSLGVEGKYQDYLKVHTKVGLPCPICGTNLVKKETESAYFCPNKKCDARNIEGLIDIVSNGLIASYFTKGRLSIRSPIRLPAVWEEWKIWKIWEIWEK